MRFSVNFLLHTTQFSSLQHFANLIKSDKQNGLANLLPKKHQLLKKNSRHAKKIWLHYEKDKTHNLRMAVCTQILLLKIHLFHSRTYFKPYLEIQIAVQNIEIKKKKTIFILVPLKCAIKQPVILGEQINLTQLVGSQSTTGLMYFSYNITSLCSSPSSSQTRSYSLGSHLLLRYCLFYRIT